MYLRYIRGARAGQTFDEPVEVARKVIQDKDAVPVTRPREMAVLPQRETRVQAEREIAAPAPMPKPKRGRRGGRRK
jgi:hypothetical protein